MSSIYVCSDVRISKSFPRSLVSHRQRLPHPSQSPSLPLPMRWAPNPHIHGLPWYDICFSTFHCSLHHLHPIIVHSHGTCSQNECFLEWAGMFPRMSRLFHASRSQFPQFLNVDIQDSFLPSPSPTYSPRLGSSSCHPQISPDFLQAELTCLQWYWSP